MATSKKAAKTSGNVIHATDDDFDAIRKGAGCPVLLDLWAPWCGPCVEMGPILEKLADAYAGRLKVVKVDVDDNPDLADKLKAEIIPLLVLMSGRHRARLVGSRPKKELVAWIDEKLAAWAAD